MFSDKKNKCLINIVGISGLLHDIGKKNDFFQYKLSKNKIVADPYRHEFISCKIIEACFFLYKDEWLKALSQNINEEEVANYFKNDLNKNKISKELPLYIKIICYLILVHHKLPINNKNAYIDKSFTTMDELFGRYVNADWGYRNEDCLKENKSCFAFSNGLNLDDKNKSLLKKYILKLDVSTIEEIVSTPETLFPFISFARFGLMMSDHKVSSIYEEHEKKESKLWANKNKKNNKGKITYNQTIEDHLNKVSLTAVDIIQQLPHILSKLPFVKNDYLDEKSIEDFSWQNTVVDSIKQYKKNNNNSVFFCTNMSSTGTGKTFGNAKIINAISDDLRYTLAVGLRTLVLQTGDSYIHDVKFNKEDISVCIGNDIIQKLHEEDSDFYSEKEDLMHTQSKYEEFFNKDFESLSTEFLDILFNNKTKYKSFLYKPVLVCTIDYMMRLTQTIKGGKHLLPFLRLLSSDLIIDEIDDFSKNDLKAISQLVYYSGMFGRNVIISSATIAPDLAEGLAKAHEKGLLAHNKFFSQYKEQAILICDEYNTEIKNVKFDTKEYITLHNYFIENRVKNLENAVIKRKGHIVKIPIKTKEGLFEEVKKEIVSLHDNNHIVDEFSGKKVSIGVIRTANISFCVELTKYLLGENIQGYDIKTMCYHSRQILLLRHEQEKYLAKVLRRKYKYGEKVNITDKTMREHIDGSSSNNVVFILVATPVEEVGCDHDFDWGIIEPSSMHSIVQMVGRLLRHRILDRSIETDNVGILQYNYASLTKKYSRQNNKCFLYPGVEGESNIKMNTHNVCELLNEKEINKSINSIPCILKPQNMSPNHSLNDAEHFVFEKFNNYVSVGAGYLHGYIHEYWFLTAIPQELNKFRESNVKTEDLLAIQTVNGLDFMKKDLESNKYISKTTVLNIEPDCFPVSENLWLKRDYKESLLKKSKLYSKDIDELSMLYGNISLIHNEKKVNYYNDNLGLYRI